MKLVIDRSKWYRGNGGDGSRLRRSDGKQCCLGFLGEACGVHGGGLLDVEYPVPATRATKRASKEWPSWLFVTAKGNSYDYATRLAIANDAHGDEALRESAITAIFAEHGVEVVFVDGPEAP